MAGDTLIASGQSVNFGGAVPGGGAESLDWMHRGDGRDLIGLGATHEEFAGAQLDIARVTGGLGVGSAGTLLGTVEAGPANDGSSHYTFIRMTFNATQALSQVLQLAGGTQYVAADEARTLLLRAATTWLPLQSLAVRTEVGESVGGNLPTRFATLRTDYVGRLQIYAGASLGKGAESVVELNGVSYQNFWDGFVGIGVPLSRCTFTLSWDRLALQSVIRKSMTLTLTVPLGRGT